MYEQILTHTGMDREQAIVYEALLRSGSTTAGALCKQIALKRSLVYKVLNELVRLELAQKHEEPGKKMMFSAMHPLSLKEAIEKKERDAKDAKAAFEGILPALVSDFNLAVGRPGVQFFEGIEGAERVLFDSLRSKGTIDAYVDLETVLQSEAFQNLNKKYTKKRVEAFLDRRVIMPESKLIREYLGNFVSKDRQSFTQRRFTKNSRELWQSMMQMYDNKVTYITFHHENIVSVIIEDPFIFRLHKQLFDRLWEMLPNEYDGKELT